MIRSTTAPHHSAASQENKIIDHSVITRFDEAALSHVKDLLGNVPDFWMNKFGDWYNWYSTFNWTLHQWLTKAWKQDGYVSDFAWHWVFVDAQDIFEGRS